MPSKGFVPRRPPSPSSSSDSDSDASSMDTAELAAMGLSPRRATRPSPAKAKADRSSPKRAEKTGANGSSAKAAALERPRGVHMGRSPLSLEPVRAAVREEPPPPLAPAAAYASPEPEDSPVPETPESAARPAADSPLGASLGGALGTAWLEQSESASLPPDEPDGIDTPSKVGSLQVFEHVGNSKGDARTNRHRAFYADVTKPTECSSVLAVLRDNTEGTGELLSYAFRVGRRKHSADDGKGGHAGTGKVLAELLEIVAANNVLLVLLVSPGTGQQVTWDQGICSPQVSCARQLLEQRGFRTPFDAGAILECPTCRAVVKVPTCQPCMLCPQPDCQLKLQLEDLRRRYGVEGEEADALVDALKVMARAMGVPQPLVARREAAVADQATHHGSDVSSSTALAGALEQLILEQQIRPIHALAGKWLQPHELLGLNSTSEMEEYKPYELQEAAARVANPSSAVAVHDLTSRIVGSTRSPAGVQLAFAGGKESPGSPARTRRDNSRASRANRTSSISRERKGGGTVADGPVDEMDVQIALAERFWRAQLAAGDSN